MAFAYVVPARNDLTWYSYQTTLSGVIFNLEFKYNTRMQRWALDINDSNGNLILAGIPLLILRNLTGQYVTLALPEGPLFVTDDTNQYQQPTQYSFGLQNTVWYIDPTQS